MAELKARVRTFGGPPTSLIARRQLTIYRQNPGTSLSPHKSILETKSFEEDEDPHTMWAEPLPLDAVESFSS